MTKTLNESGLVAVEGERAVLGAVLLNEGVLCEVMDVLGDRGERFHVGSHGRIWEGMVRLAASGGVVDLVTLGGVLRERGHLDGVGGVSYLAELVSAVPSSAHAVHYAGLVRDAWVRRELVGLGARLGRDAKVGEVGALVEDVEGALWRLGSGRRVGPVGVDAVAGDAAARVLQAFDARGLTGLGTSFGSLDCLLGGLQPGQYCIVAGPTGGGKTAFALQVARYVSMVLARRVVYFSLEMSAGALAERMLYAVGGVDRRLVVENRYTRVDLQGRLMRAVTALSGAPLEIDSSAPLTTAMMRSRTRRAAMRGDLGLVVVDYLQLLSGSGRFDNRTEEVGQISGSVKALAMELGVPVLALCQLNRRAAQEGGGPALHHLRESSRLEQDADVVILLSPADEGPDELKVEVAKHRQGATGVFHVRFHKALQVMEDMGSGPAWMGGRRAPGAGEGASRAAGDYQYEAEFGEVEAPFGEEEEVLF